MRGTENKMAYKKSNDTLIKLKKMLKDGKTEPLYLFFGEESYLKELYEEKIKELVPDGGFPDFNRFKFEGPDNELNDYDDAWENFPMMAEKKLIIIKDSGIFNRPNEEQKNFWQEKFKHTSEDMVVIFDETKVDKRSVTYKALAKNGTAVEFDFLGDSDLVAWVNKQSLNAKVKMSKDTAYYFINVCGRGLNTLQSEFNKLLEYCDDGEITKNDVDTVVSKSLEVQVFDLTDAIMKHDANTAMEVVGGLRSSSQSALAILYLIGATVEKMLKAKTMEGENIRAVAEKLGCAPFIAGKYAEGARAFSEKALIRMNVRIPEIDYEIKLGRLDMWTGVEQYISECIYYRD